MRVNIIQINENTRLVVWQDADTPDPRLDDPEMTEQDETFRAWARGDVYGVVLEKRTELYEKNEDGTFNETPVFERWDHVESLWGCYLTPQYTAEMVAKECWDVE